MNRMIDLLLKIPGWARSALWIVTAISFYLFGNWYLHKYSGGVAGSRVMGLWIGAIAAAAAALLSWMPTSRWAIYTLKAISPIFILAGTLQLLFSIILASRVPPGYSLAAIAISVCTLLTAASSLIQAMRTLVEAGDA